MGGGFFSVVVGEVQVSLNIIIMCGGLKLYFANSERGGIS